MSVVPNQWKLETVLRGELTTVGVEGQEVLMGSFMVVMVINLPLTAS